MRMMPARAVLAVFLEFSFQMSRGAGIDGRSSAFTILFAPAISLVTVSVNTDFSPRVQKSHCHLIQGIMTFEHVLF